MVRLQAFYSAYRVLRAAQRSRLSALVRTANYWRVRLKDSRARSDIENQQDLATRFTMVALSLSYGEAAEDIGLFISSKGWDSETAGKQVSAALGLVEVAHPFLYEKATAVTGRREVWAGVADSKDQSVTAS